MCDLIEEEKGNETKEFNGRMEMYSCSKQDYTQIFIERVDFMVPLYQEVSSRLARILAAQVFEGGNVQLNKRSLTRERQ